MASKFRLVVDDVVDFPVSLTLRNAGKDSTFTFTLMGRRLTSQQALDYFDPAGAKSDMTVREVLLANITDWHGQKLVLDASGEPAAFSPEALDAMLDVPGAAMVLLKAYQHALRAHDGAEGRRKN